MNSIQRLIGAVFPPYRYSIVRREQGALFSALIDSLSNEFSDLKEQTSNSTFLSLENWALFPDYKFVSSAFPGESLSRFKKPGRNYKISGIKIFSRQQNKFVDVELLVNKNLIVGLKIDHPTYALSDFDTTRIVGHNATKSPFEFPKSGIDKFVETLDQETREMLNSDDMADIELGTRTLYTFYDMEDGNYLAVDKLQKVYSLVHDARPPIKQVNATFKEILTDLRNGAFDKQKHLDERYRNGK